MFRKRRRPTPAFKIPSPFNPLHGEQANLRQDGTAPYCAMMQIAAEDIYDDYVICRGFDPRILKFIDYDPFDPNKPGISVAKPFGKRVVGAYSVAEIYPALLPTQGNAGFADFRQVIFTPPSPASVRWRVGQNPGKVIGGGAEGGQPESLSDEIGILYDHNGKVVNWLLVDSQLGSGGGGDEIRFRVVDVYCDDDETIAMVEWTHYTRCPEEPPGIDPYTGLIPVHDSCVFSYYTIEQLMQGDSGQGVSGRATYWYPRDSNCAGVWIVDSVCGQPECA